MGAGPQPAAARAVDALARPAARSDAIGRTATAAPRTTTTPAPAADVFGLAIEQIGEAAAASQVTLHELSSQTESLEDAFLAATADAQEYRSGGAVVIRTITPSGSSCARCSRTGARDRSPIAFPIVIASLAAMFGDFDGEQPLSDDFGGLVVGTAIVTAMLLGAWRRSA